MCMTRHFLLTSNAIEAQQSAHCGTTAAAEKDKQPACMDLKEEVTHKILKGTPDRGRQARWPVSSRERAGKALLQPLILRGLLSCG